MDENNVMETATALYELAEKVGIEGALKVAFDDNVSMSLKVPKELLGTELIAFNFPSRIKNVINRWCGIYSDKPKTVERIVSLLGMGDYAKEFVTGYGNKARSFLKTFLLIESYERYTDEQKLNFCRDIVLRNCE